MKILILTGYDKTYQDNQLGILSENKNKNYAEVNGYDFYSDKDCNPNLHHFFYKFESILKFIDKYDYIFWIDADAFFVNFSKKIESFIKPNKNFIATIDKEYLNTGVFIVKCCDEIKNVFKKVLSEGPTLQHPFPDAKILMDYFQKEDSTWDIINPQYLLNSYKYELYGKIHDDGEYKEGESIVLHFPGMPYSKRIESYYKYDVENLK